MTDASMEDGTTTMMPTLSVNETDLHSLSPAAETIVGAVLLCLITMTAFFGNVLLWCVVVRNPSLRTTSNALVLCLSSADILVSVVNMPITIVTILSGGKFYGDGLCVALGFASMTFFIASVMSLAAISINRYVLIVHPNRFKAVYTVRNTGFVILVVWLLSLALASPPLLGWAQYGYLPGQSFCFCDWKSSISYTFFMVIVCFGGPCSVMSFCYYKILRVVRKSRKRIAAGSDVTSVGSAHSGISNNNSQMKPAEGGGDVELFVPVKQSRARSIKNAFRRQLTRSPSKEPTPGKSHNISIESISGLVKNEGDRSHIQNTNSSPKRVTASRQGGSLKMPHVRVYDASPPHRSVSLEADCQRSGSFVKRGGDSSTRKNGKTSPTNGRVVRRSSGSLLAVPGQKASTMLRRKRAKTAREIRRKQEELKLTKSFLVVILVFIVCWFPFCITMFWSVFSPYPVYRPVDMASLLLGFFNSCCNPIIYGVMNRRFRAGYKQLIVCLVRTPCSRQSGAGKIAGLERSFGSVSGTVPACADPRDEEGSYNTVER